MSEEGTAQREITVEEAITLANFAQQHGQIKEAEEIYRRVLAVCPDCADALHFSGLLAFSKGRREEGLALIEKSVSLAPDHAGFWNNLGNALKELERIPQAATAYERAIALNPQFADAHHNLGVVASLQKNYPAAVAAYGRALAADANRADTLCNLGNTFEKLDRLDESAAAFRSAIALKPNDPKAYGRLGRILWRQGRQEEATEAITRTTQLDPKDPMGFCLLAGILSAQGHTQEAFEAYDKALGLDPTHYLINVLYGQALIADGKVDRAKAIWKRWSEADPENPVPRHFLEVGSGEGIPERGGDDFILRIFDRFADSFDEKLKHLEYKAPELVAEALRRIYPQPDGSLGILDAGCGTGLCGPLLRPFAQRLEGVDLSPKMLEKAAARGGYDELVAAELTAFIQERTNAYDVIACADTLCYFGKLEPVMAAAAKALRDGGCFIFTLEKMQRANEGVNVALEPTGRYTHTEAYARSAITGAGMEVAQLTSKALRKESLMPVEGMVVTARKRPASTMDGC